MDRLPGGDLADLIARRRAYVQHLDRTGPQPASQRYEVKEVEDELTIRWRWLQRDHVVLLVLSVALAVVAAVLSGRGHPSRTEAMWDFVPLGLALVALAMAYTAIEGILNATTITVSPRGLTIRIGPLPWRRSLTLPRRDIAHLQVKATFGKGNHGWTKVDLCAVDAQGRARTLVRKLESESTALWLEQLIERKLEIHAVAARWPS